MTQKPKQRISDNIRYLLIASAIIASLALWTISILITIAGIILTMLIAYRFSPETDKSTGKLAEGQENYSET